MKAKAIDDTREISGAALKSSSNAPTAGRIVAANATHQLPQPNFTIATTSEFHSTTNINPIAANEDEPLPPQSKNGVAVATDSPHEAACVLIGSDEDPKQLQQKRATAPKSHTTPKNSRYALKKFAKLMCQS
ncbi:hypothetical protein ACH5RR_018617 [Cinchona calisaya]|uniref:Uncharacterized protein n=1 Tax=Cinchona calisaya TaxID=153742 RepID=A0ABD2ZMF8_9GENT